MDKPMFIPVRASGVGAVKLGADGRQITTHKRRQPHMVGACGVVQARVALMDHQVLHAWSARTLNREGHQWVLFGISLFMQLSTAQYSTCY